MMLIRSLPGIELVVDSIYVPMLLPDEYKHIAEKVSNAIIGVPNFYKYKRAMKAVTDSFLCIMRIHALLVDR